MVHKNMITFCLSWKRIYIIYRGYDAASGTKTKHEIDAQETPASVMHCPAGVTGRIPTGTRDHGAGDRGTVHVQLAL